MVLSCNFNGLGDLADLLEDEGRIRKWGFA